jgi:hypothetical protein
MHVRLCVDQLRVLAERDLAHDFRGSLAGRNREIERGWPGVEEVALLRSGLGQHETELRDVGCRFSGGGVVQLEDQIGALGDELGSALHIEGLRAEAWIELPEDVVPFLDRVAAEDVLIGL